MLAVRRQGPGRGRPVRGRVVLAALAGPALAGSVLLAGCGGSSSAAPAARASGPTFAERVCGDARQAAAQALGAALSVRIVSPDAASLQCVLTGQHVQLTVSSQAGSRAYTEFDTEVAHQDQVFGPGISDPSQIPAQVTVPGSVVAVWIPAQLLLVATDATPTTGGAYVTVAVTGSGAPAAVALRAAQAAARGTFAGHPDGPS